MRRNRRTASRGFTLIELLLVVVIIGILAAIVVPRLTGRTEDAQIGATKATMTNIRTALGLYETDNGKFPTQDQDLIALIVKPTAAPEPKKWRKYLDTSEVPTDAWGNKITYKNPGEKNTDGYDLVSAGPDGVAGNDDDIVMP
ncbi:MAG TPA: type II secretion system major pseudopilin GspG [Planctomycetota bacterium]|jgi:general secretion pathway protein G|nr:type II secretion system major pseudopilin GspG [Planctomycetota bacterium]